jgi:hypothetical protein
MKSLRDAATRAEVVQRVRRLAPDTQRQWGTMDCTKMLAHVNESLRMATGELPVRFKKTPLRFRLVRNAVIYLLPFPKGTPTAPELISRTPEEFGAEADAFCRRVEAFPQEVPGGWPVHPVFGQLSAKDWGVLAYRHTDHHLRQFGV